MRTLIVAVFLLFSAALSLCAEEVTWLGERYSVALSFSTTQSERVPLPEKIALPEYPAAMILADIGGEVSIEYQVDAKGRVSSIQVSKSGGEDFQRSVELAAKSWRFRPARDRTTGKLVAVIMRCTVCFSTEAKEPNQSSQRNAMARPVSVFESRSSRG